MRTCYLHVGMPKTGSTSIQSAFRSYDDGELACAQMGSVSHSGSVTITFSSQPSSTRIARVNGLTGVKLEKFRSECSADFQTSLVGEKNIIISGEGIIQQLSQRKADVVALYAELRKHFGRIVTIAYVRPYSAGLSSRSQTRIRIGASHLALPEPGFASFFESVFENSDPADVEIARFDRADLLDGDVVADFASRVGAHKLPGGERPNLNESLTTEALGTMLAVNKYVLPSLPPLPRKAVRLFLNRSLQNQGSIKFGLAPELIEQQTVKHAQDIGWLEQRTGLELRGKIPAVEYPVSDENQLFDCALPLPVFEGRALKFFPKVRQHLRDNAPGALANRLLSND